MMTIAEVMQNGQTVKVYSGCEPAEGSDPGKVLECAHFERYGEVICKLRLTC